MCRPDVGCDAGFCDPEPGQADRVCIDGRCVPPCTTIRLCDETSECLGLGECVELSGGRPDIRSSAGSYSPRGACVERAVSAGSGLPRTEALCDTTWISWSRMYLHEFTFGAFGTRLLHTVSWAHGDADSDGCVNGVDTEPCATSTFCDAGDPTPPPTCPDQTQAQCCRVEGGEYVCDGNLGACGCSTLNTCTPSVRVSDNAACAPIVDGGAPGLCVRPNEPGALGVCVYEEFLSSCSDVEALSLESCFLTTGRTRTDDFFLGDCDGDGCPNGQDSDSCAACDDARCATVSADTRAGCGAVENPGQNDPAMCLPPDAGPVMELDAGMDAGPALDAGAVTDATPNNRARFGGNGCQCIAGSPRRARPLPVAVVALALLARKKRGPRRPRAVAL